MGKGRKEIVNGWAKWILVAIAVIAAIYGNYRNAAVLKNEVKHLAADVVELKADVKTLTQYLMKGTS